MTWATLDMPLAQYIRERAGRYHRSDFSREGKSLQFFILQRVLDFIRKGIEAGHAALLGLQSSTLSDGSLEKALSDFRNDFAPTALAGLKIVIIGRTKQLAPTVHVQLYLVAREALLNALRHSEARRVEVEIEYRRRKLRVMVRDNGTGIDPQTLQRGQSHRSGMIIMEERAASIGATLRVWSKREAGTEVEISVPINGATFLRS
jgi:signal transduction histidine kinase